MPRSRTDTERLRIIVLLGGAVSAFVFLGFMLWRIQVAHGLEYQDNLEQQSVRRVRLPGMRGRIMDRHGRRLADNRPNYGIAIFLEELRKPGGWSNTVVSVQEVLREVSGCIGRSADITTDDIWAHIRRRLPLPLVAWKSLTSEEMARWAEKASTMPGVDIHIETARTYPNGPLACHLLGYVGRADPQFDDEEPFHFYVPEMQGKSGIEKHLDAELKGESGGQLVRVDVSGYRFEDLGTRDPKVGKDVYLALDSRIQGLAEDALKGQTGAVVVLDPRNGDVLASASSPSYNPNAFIPAIPVDTWRDILDNPGKPLLNRVVAGGYTPGSTFKPVVVLAAREGDIVPASKTFNCPGYFMLGKARFNCWYHPGHGALDMREALEHSCNVYLFHLGLLCGHERIVHMARAMGLGEKTGIELDYEAPGLVPDNAWKRKIYHDAWRDGDTCNLSIGQGALTVTPLQMAVVVATIANGGHVYKPRLVLGTGSRDDGNYEEIAPLIRNEMHWSPGTIQLVRAGMKDVVMAPRGTGRKARAHGITMAGKTGTAEYGKKDEGHRYGWMIAFAPFDKPRYAIAIVIEEAVSGGTTAAPLMKKIVEGIFGEEAQT